MAKVLTEREVEDIGQSGAPYLDPKRCCTKARAEELNCTVTAPSGATNNQLVTEVKGIITIPTPINWSGNYNGGWHEAIFQTVSGASITKYRYYSTDDSNWTEITANPRRQSAGSMYVQAYYTPDSNHSGGGWSSTATVAISKATGSVTVTGKNLDSTGSAQPLVSVSNQNTGTMHYRVGTSGSWGTSIPKATAAGTYTVYYYSEASTNYTAVGSASSPKSVTSTIGVYILRGPNSVTLANGVWNGNYGFESSKSGTYSPVTVSYGANVSASARQLSGTNGEVTFSWSGTSSGTDSITLKQTASGKTLTTTVVKN